MYISLKFDIYTSIGTTDIYDPNFGGETSRSRTTSGRAVKRKYVMSNDVDSDKSDCSSYGDPSGEMKVDLARIVLDKKYVILAYMY